MLRKQRRADGGFDVETLLLGPAVFLDVWALRELSSRTSSELRRRFASALRKKNGSLLVSSAWFTELDTLKGDARLRAQSFLSSLGEHWLLINPVVSLVAAREARDEIGAYLSGASLYAYVEERSGELLRAGLDPRALADGDFFDLGRTFDWTPEDTQDDEDASDDGDPSGDEAAAEMTPAAQAQALKDTAKARAEADRDAQRRDRSASGLLYPRVPFDSGRMLCVHNAIWREVTKRSLGRVWMDNDGFDVVHLIPALTVGGFVAVDSDWQSIGLRAAADLPANHARIYRPGELEQLIVDLEAWRRTET